MSERSDLPELIRASATESMPADYVALTARRLGIAAAATAILHVIYLVLYRTLWSASANRIGMLTGFAGLVVSLAAAGYLLSGQRPAVRVGLLAIAYEITLSFILSVSQSVAVDYHTPSAEVPWIAVMIVLFPFLIPASPRMILAASLASAATMPLAIALLFAATERPWPTGAVLASYVLPAFLCAFLAWAPTITLHRMGVAVQQARRLGNYELVALLGQGGMGDVWRANHRLLARPAAVKLIKPEVLGAESAASRAAILRRFEEEAQATASLDSVHTVELYDFGVSPDGVLFYVMELLRGLDVRQLVERFGPLPSSRTAHLLFQACDSLEDAHGRGLIHRDIKPANLFITRKGATCDFLKVLDFGLVKRWRADTSERLSQSPSELAGVETPIQQTAAGQIVGTPAFLAPEAALGTQAVDGRADLYALGCVGYWMLTGQPVFDEPTAIATAAAHITKDPVPPSQRVDRSIDPALEQLILECLQKDRDRRPASAAALGERLSTVRVNDPWSREQASDWWAENVPDS